MKSFTDWKQDQGVEYTIIVKLDNSTIYTETRTTGDSACEAIGRAEAFADRHLAQKYINDEEDVYAKPEL